MTISKKNGKWYCRFQLNGERHHYLCSGATTEKEARKLENQFLYKLQQQQNGVIPKEVKRIKLKVLNKLYDDYARINKKSYGRDSFTKVISEYFKTETYVDTITTEDVEKFKLWLKTEKGYSNSTINKYRAALSKRFNLGISNKLIKENPVTEASAFKEDNYKVRYLTKEEEDRLYKKIDELNPHIKPLVTTALKTGMRRGEIFHLKWDNIDFDYNFIEILESKSGKSRRIPLSDSLIKLFNEIPKTSEYVFINKETGKPYTDIKNSWHNVCNKANVKNFRFHDLRHTVATRMVEKGVPLPVVQEILGHAKISTTMRYVHSVGKQKLDAIKVLDLYN